MSYTCGVGHKQLTELSDTFQGELILFDENPDGVSHELFGDFEDIRRHCGGKKNHLGLSRKELEDVVNRVLEAGREHFIGLVKAEHLDAFGLERSTVDHVEHATGSTDDDVRAFLQSRPVLANQSAADTGVAVDIEVVAEGNDHFLDLLREFSGRSEDESLSLLDSRVNLQVSHRPDQK